MNKKVRNIIVSILLTIVAVVYTVLVTKIDVKPIGPNGSVVGFASLNAFFVKAIGSHMRIYKITEYLGLIPIVLAGIYAIIGLIQLIKRKSLKKVDVELYVLACFYAVVLGVYFLFEKLVINYRPILMDGQLDPSYPSSHTVLALCFCLSSIIVNSRIFSKSKLAKCENVLSLLLIYAITLGRFISGVHWFSDIIGGILISFALIALFNMVLILVSKRKEKTHFIWYILVIVGLLIGGCVGTFVYHKINNKVTIVDNIKYNKDGIPLPEVTGGLRGELGIDKNVNEETIDKYLGRSDSVYRDMRMLEDPASYENIGGNRFLDGYIKGFEVIPLPYIIPVSDLPEEVGETYIGNTLFKLNADGTYSANYKESYQIIEKLFPKDKYIFLMCGGGGYAGMMKKFLVTLGWDENKIWVVGGYWYYQGENDIKVPKKDEYEYDFTNVPYHEINFYELTKLRNEKSGLMKLSSRYYDTLENSDFYNLCPDYYDLLDKGYTDDQAWSIVTNGYVKQGEYIDNLLTQKESFILAFTDYEDACVDELYLSGLIRDVMADYSVYIYSVDPSVYENTSLYKDYRYFPGVMIVKNGEVYKYFDSNDDFSKKLYDEEDYSKRVILLEDWIKKYVVL